MKRFITTIVQLTIILCCQAEVYNTTQIRHLNKQTGLTNDQVTVLKQDHHGYLWAGTANGLNRIDGHEVFTWDSPKHPLYDLPISDIETDKENNCLWIFTPQGMAGCILFDNNQLIPYTPDKADSILKQHHKGKLYMWQYGPTKHCKRSRLNKGKWNAETVRHEVTDIITDEEGNDWLLTTHGLYLNGFEQKLPHSDDVTHISTYRNICLALTPQEILVYNHSRRIARRSTLPAGYHHMDQCTGLTTWGDHLLIFTPERTVAYQIMDGKFSTPSNIQMRGGHLLPNNGKSSYVYDRKGKLIRLGHDGTVHSLQLLPVEVARQSDGIMPHAAIITPTTEAFSIYGNGIHFLDLKSGKSIHYRQEKTPNLIPDNRIQAILSDHTGGLWIAMHQSGLTYLRLNKEVEAADSLRIPQTPRPLITFVTIDGEKHLIDANEKSLPYTHNNVNWHFSSIAYGQMEKVRYQYYLTGHDSTWQTPTQLHIAKYKELAPGRYTFHVRASIDGSHWSKESIHTIVIDEPWWSQWPAYVATLAIFAAMGLFLYLIVYRFIHPERATTEEAPTTEGTPQIPTEETPEETPEEPKLSHLTAKEERFKQLLYTLMEEHIEDPDFTVEEFATCANLKRTQFYTKVKHIMGITPIELLRKAHLEHAAKLLIETDLNIDEIRERCGFSNSTAFYNYFKQQYGVTPRQYRQNCLAK